MAYAASRLQRDVAEDLAQEVLMLLEEKYRQVAALDELLPLCFQILRFKMMSLVRKSARRGDYKQVSLEDLPLPDPEQNPESRAAVIEMRERLRQALSRLEGRCREMFRLKLEGRTFTEIQGILKASSLNTVYTWDFRCRKQLLRLMGGRWGTEP
ncbi:MAG: RNA polymerase sigma factor [Bryobacteraceae bacterium]|nr:RNA polymerase sigma factor [Bryobacteraceae bacterium]